MLPTSRARAYTLDMEHLDELKNTMLDKLRQGEHLDTILNTTTDYALKFYRFCLFPLLGHHTPNPKILELEARRDELSNKSITVTKELLSGYLTSQQQKALWDCETESHDDLVNFTIEEVAKAKRQERQTQIILDTVRGTSVNGKKLSELRELGETPQKIYEKYLALLTTELNITDPDMLEYLSLFVDQSALIMIGAHVKQFMMGAGTQWKFEANEVRNLEIDENNDVILTYQQNFYGFCPQKKTGGDYEADDMQPSQATNICRFKITKVDTDDSTLAYSNIQVDLLDNYLDIHDKALKESFFKKQVTEAYNVSYVHFGDKNYFERIRDGEQLLPCEVEMLKSYLQRFKRSEYSTKPITPKTSDYLLMAWVDVDSCVLLFQDTSLLDKMRETGVNLHDWLIILKEKHKDSVEFNTMVSAYEHILKSMQNDGFVQQYTTILAHLKNPNAAPMVHYFLRYEAPKDFVMQIVKKPAYMNELDARSLREIGLKFPEVAEMLCDQSLFKRMRYRIKGEKTPRGKLTPLIYADWLSQNPAMWQTHFEKDTVFRRIRRAGRRSLRAELDHSGLRKLVRTGSADIIRHDPDLFRKYIEQSTADELIEDLAELRAEQQDLFLSQPAFASKVSHGNAHSKYKLIEAKLQKTHALKNNLCQMVEAKTQAFEDQGLQVSKRRYLRAKLIYAVDVVKRIGRSSKENAHADALHRAAVSEYEKQLLKQIPSASIKKQYMANIRRTGTRQDAHAIKQAMLEAIKEETIVANIFSLISDNNHSEVGGIVQAIKKLDAEELDLLFLQNGHFAATYFIAHCNGDDLVTCLSKSTVLQKFIYSDVESRMLLRFGDTLSEKNIVKLYKLAKDSHAIDDYQFWMNAEVKAKLLQYYEANPLKFTESFYDALNQDLRTVFDDSVKLANKINYFKDKAARQSMVERIVTDRIKPASKTDGSTSSVETVSDDIEFCQAYFNKLLVDADFRRSTISVIYRKALWHALVAQASIDQLYMFVLYGHDDLYQLNSTEFILGDKPLERLLNGITPNQLALLFLKDYRLVGIVLERGFKNQFDDKLKAALEITARNMGNNERQLLLSIVGVDYMPLLAFNKDDTSKRKELRDTSQYPVLKNTNVETLYSRCNATVTYDQSGEVTRSLLTDSEMMMALKPCGQLAELIAQIAKNDEASGTTQHATTFANNVIYTLFKRPQFEPVSSPTLLINLLRHAAIDLLVTYVYQHSERLQNTFTDIDAWELLIDRFLEMPQNAQGFDLICQMFANSFTQATFDETSSLTPHKINDFASLLIKKLAKDNFQFDIPYKNPIAKLALDTILAGNFKDKQLADLYLSQRTIEHGKNALAELINNTTSVINAIVNGHPSQQDNKPVAANELAKMLIRELEVYGDNPLSRLAAEIVSGKRLHYIFDAAAIESIERIIILYPEACHSLHAIYHINHHIAEKTQSSPVIMNALFETLADDDDIILIINDDPHLIAHLAPGTIPKLPDIFTKLSTSQKLQWVESALKLGKDDAVNTLLASGDILSLMHEHMPCDQRVYLIKTILSNPNLDTTRSLAFKNDWISAYFANDVDELTAKKDPISMLHVKELYQALYNNSSSKEQRFLITKTLLAQLNRHVRAQDLQVIKLLLDSDIDAVAICELILIAAYKTTGFSEFISEAISNDNAFYETLIKHTNVKQFLKFMQMTPGIESALFSRFSTTAKSPALDDKVYEIIKASVNEPDMIASSLDAVPLLSGFLIQKSWQSQRCLQLLGSNASNLFTQLIASAKHADLFQLYAYVSQQKVTSAFAFLNRKDGPFYQRVDSEINQLINNLTTNNSDALIHWYLQENPSVQVNGDLNDRALFNIAARIDSDRFVTILQKASPNLLGPLYLNDKLTEHRLLFLANEHVAHRLLIPDDLPMSRLVIRQFAADFIESLKANPDTTITHCYNIASEILRDENPSDSHLQAYALIMSAFQRFLSEDHYLLLNTALSQSEQTSSCQQTITSYFEKLSAQPNTGNENKDEITAHFEELNKLFNQINSDMKHLSSRDDKFFSLKQQFEKRCLGVKASHPTDNEAPTHLRSQKV